MIAALLDHLWQSTLFAAPIALLASLLRRQAASLRFNLWLAASLKFLLPFSLLVLIGQRLLPPVTVPGAVMAALKPAVQPFSATTATSYIPTMIPGEWLALLWAGGALAALSLTVWRVLELRSILRGAVDLDIVAPVPVRSAPSFLEPGLVGIWRPVILLPKAIAKSLSCAELDAVLAHELCHLRRRDNITAAAHMLVEALFWFHPPVWWIGRRLVEERERACDESVLAAGNLPLVYAESILKVCRHYVQTPLACASGISGPDLETRLTAIMAGGTAMEVPPCTTRLLAAAAAASLILPIAAGMLGTMPVTRLATQIETVLATPLQIAPALPPITSQRKTPQRHRAAAKPAARVIAPSVVPVPPVPVRIEAPTAPIPDIFPASMPVDDMVCRPPQQLPGSRFSGPVICKRQSEWAALRTKGQDIAPDGSIIVASSYEKSRSLSPQTCVRAPPAATMALGTWNVGCL